MSISDLQCLWCKGDQCKERSHMLDAGGKELPHALHFTFMFKNVALINSFILNVTSSGSFQEENIMKSQHTKRMGIASFYSTRDLLYIEQVYEHTSTPLEQQGLLNLAPEPLFQVSKAEELLDSV